MSILTVEKLSHSFGGRVIFEDVSFRLLKGEHIGLVGANGEGKSTFMKIITNNLEPEEGKIIWSNKVKVGYLDQHAVLSEGLSIYDVLKTAYDSLFEMEATIMDYYNKMCDCTEDEMNQMLEEIGEYQEYLDHHDFYLIDAKINEVAAAFGLKDLGLDTDVTNLSGGQRTRILLAKLLLQKPDILLLDEPTNDLDLKSINWLQDFLIDFENTVIVVSHDRYFLNKVCTHIADVDFGKIKVYPGNYDFWYESSQLALKQMKEQKLHSQITNLV